MFTTSDLADLICTHGFDRLIDRWFLGTLKKELDILGDVSSCQDSGDKVNSPLMSEVFSETPGEQR